MDPATFLSLVLACAPQVHPDTARALVQVESSFNPWAIGVVGGSLDRQPHDRAEALATAQQRRPALVITEVMLPGVSGYELCRAVKDWYGPRVPVILMSRGAVG